MTSATEAASGASTPVGDVLNAGVATISLDQTVVFTQYIRLVLPLDGFVFLVRSDLVNPNSYWAQAQAAAALLGFPASFSTKGSLHYGTDTSQDEAHTFTSNSVVFTTDGDVPYLNHSDPLVVYLGVIDNVRFAFAQRKPFYRQADLWHYTGVAVYSDLVTQVIDDPALIDTTDLVVSNSLPLWLQLLTYTPAVAINANPGIVLYPSHTVPKNLYPPYGVVHIEPEGTEGIQAAPYFNYQMTQTQLCVDRVRITLYGCRNDAALDFLAWVGQYTLFTDNFGIMNIPVVRDEKRGQVELNAIAEKKTLVFDVNYYQTRVNDVARQLIEEAFTTFIVAA